jgi:LEA14-like dessication related protein
VGCAHLGAVVEKPTVTLSRVEVTEVGLTGFAATFTFDVVNDNPVRLDLARFEYSIDMDGRRVIEGQARQPLSVPARGTGQLRLPVAIRLTELLPTLASLVARAELAYTIHATMGFDTPIGGIDVGVSSSGTLPRPLSFR